MQFISWNVLHIYHEIKYCNNMSPVLDMYRNKEKDRLNEICKTLQKYYDDTIICLQEVPGDLYELLKQQFKDHNIYQHKYPRVPTSNDKIYTHEYECLVTIIPKSVIAQSTKFIQSKFDNGKGAIVIITDKYSIVNTHVPFDETNRKSLLQDIYSNISDKYIMVGDMNTSKNKLEEDIVTLTKIFIVQDNIENTRKGMNGKREIIYSKIDHVITSNDINGKTFVEDTGDLSDHFIIGFDMGQ